jgi:putative DNA primase/helicase
VSFKPHALPVDPEGIPEELKQLPQWVVWHYEWIHKRQEWAKVPLQSRPLLQTPPDAQCARTNDMSTWGTFDEAMQAYQAHPPMAGDVAPSENPNEEANDGLDGIGLCLTKADPYIGIDLDDCLIDGLLIDEQARQVLELMTGTYTEVSPSGTGLRIFTKGTKPGKRCKRGNIEMYDGSSGRYLTVTGHVWRLA